MEGSDIPSQNPPRGNIRPEFVPKQPPRRRQRGALPRYDEQQPLIAKHQQISTNTTTTTTASQKINSSEDQMLSLLPPTELQTPSQQNVAPPVHPIEEASKQIGSLPQSRGPMTKRQNISHCPRESAGGAQRFSKSWHRASTQEQPQRRSPMIPADEHTLWPRQRGSILAPRDRSLQAPPLPFTGPPLFQGSSYAPAFSAQNARTSYPLIETKASFEEMWHQLEVAIQCREGMLMNMKAEMEKCASLVKNAKIDAVKEKEEVEARKVAAMENLQSVNRQMGRIKGVREGLEQISTDFSVQVAELNLLLQQVEKQQRVLEMLESLKEHYDTSENESRNHMDKSLQDCEVRLVAMENELEHSKRTSQLLEKDASKKIGDLEEFEAWCHTNTDGMKMQGALERPPGWKEQEERAVLKLPKLEPV